jgi:hypothetical protein
MGIGYHAAPTDKDILIAQIRSARLLIARKRFADFRNRYPEIDGGDIEPLDDEQIIMAALTREWVFQKNATQDIAKDA